MYINYTSSPQFLLPLNYYYASIKVQRGAHSVPHVPQQHKEEWMKQGIQRGTSESASREAKCIPLYQKRRDSRTLPILSSIFSFLFQE